jgi:hypothetical protein
VLVIARHCTQGRCRTVIHVYDIGRAELIDSEGWIDVKVVKEHSRRFVLHRVGEAFVRRGWAPETLR